jgi:serine/threonine protein kinase
MTTTEPTLELDEFEPEPFGKYYLVDRIATGGMAEIFKAKTFGEAGFENLVVIKRILAHLSDDPDFIGMFIDEAKVTVALQHRNVVRVYDFGKLGPNYFIAMECLDGKDSRQILRKLAQSRGYVPIEFAVFIAAEACKGLEYAHTKTDLQGQPYGIVHRDVSPSNILVSYDGDVKVADFGIAKAHNNLSDTDAGVLKGKYEYMSPEQAAGEDIDARSDIFALGIVLWEMLTGRRLFKADGDVATLEKVKAADVAPPSSVASRVPASLDAIVLKALAKDKNDRYPTARAFQEALAEYLFPSTSDQLHTALSGFMNELFADEIAAERERLEAGSTIAQKLHQATPAPDWSATTGAGGKASWALLGGVAVLLVVFAAVLGGGTVWWLAASTPTEVAPEKTAVDVLVDVPAQIFVDDVPFTAGPVGGMLLEGFPPGIHRIKLVADGYETVEESLAVEPGQTVRFWRTLTPITAAPTPSPTPRPTGSVAPASTAPAPATTTPEPAPAPEPAPEGGTGTLTVAIVGGGWAHVWVDGVKLDRTAPLSGHTLTAGPHEIRVENPDVGISHTQTVTVEAGGTSTVRVRPM